LATGQLPPNQTWLSHVEQLPPATRLTCRLKDNTQSRERYWHWHELAPLIDKTSLPDLADELGHRFCAAVKRQSQTPQIGLVLSGGLDSRALLAAMPDGTRTFTFGQENSPDVTIAAQVAGLKKASHDIWPLDAKNWLCPRIVGNWSLDGALNVLHMHGVEHMHKLAEDIRLCFNGAGGDGLVGGGHLFAPNELVPYLKNTLHLNLDNHPSVFNAVRETFNRTGSSHAFYIDWRMRGFTIHGPRLCQFAGLDFRIPFLDNTIQEFLYAVPLEFKLHNKLYKHMLLSTFPDYFNTIPYQATGYPISWSNWAIKGAKALKKWQQKTPEKSFASYADWLRESPARSFFETHLCDPKALMFDYCSSAPVLSLWQAHLQGENHAEMLGRYLTLELYLQQLYKQKYRTMPETEQFLSSLNSEL
jgi:asparagine synthase (glutamine-hydrolysing)